MSLPNPQPLASRFERPDERVMRHRNFDCPQYAACLTHCVDQKWVNFSCLHCALNEIRPENPELARRLPAARVLLEPGELAALESRTARLPDD